MSSNNMSHSTATTTATATKLNNLTVTNSYPSKQCGNCGAPAPRFLHQVSLLGKFSLLCTSCVLRLHPSSFCPVCFALYAVSPPIPSKRLSCSNCSSFTHSHCAGNTLLSSYLCPPCKDSSFSFFPLRDNKMDKRLALALLCAAKIAASSMGKAVTVARADADRKVREAALARKRARHALEHLLLVASTEKAAGKNENNVSGDAKIEDLHMDIDVDNGDGDGDGEGEGEGDGDGEIDVDLVRHIEDSLVKVEDIDSELN